MTWNGHDPLIGIVVVTHGSLALGFVKAAELILGAQEQLQAIELSADEDVDLTKKRLSLAIGEVDQGEGVMILTDMFGGTPSNLALTFHVESKVEVIMGANLPILLKLLSSRAGTEASVDGSRPLAELATHIAEYGKKNIQVATDILRKKPGAAG